jgi:D-beta-D-heptose 7-phosphate kinase/D-beta-D-heptose 1-phosphate adenosyltransferase
MTKNNIAVVGDCIIDQYFYVNAEKVSPEFPIPILQSKTEEPDHVLPGGAANVCYQFLYLNKNIDYFGIVDKSSLDVLQNYDFINTNYCAYISNLYSKVPIKKRYYQDVFPLCRLDIESKNYNLDQSQLNCLQSKLVENLKCKKFDVCIFSDYDKGVFNNFEISKYISALNADCIKIVDPKKGPISKWKGCNIIKPNYKEALEISGKTNCKEQAEYFVNQTGARAVLITKSSEGIFGLIDGEYFEFHPSKKSIVNSVIGAGDCFIAYFSFGISDGLSIRDSINLAYDAASKYVQNKHNQPINILDIINYKYVGPELLSNRNFKLAFTNGCFDILHPGHIHSLEFAKSKADKLVVAINSDESVINLNKSHPLINNFETRKKVIESLECVDYVVKFDQNTPLEIIKIIKPDVLVKSEEYDNPVGADLISEVYKCSIMTDFSTTKIIEKIKNS